MAGKKVEYRDLSEPEKAKLAGAIWIYGSIHISGKEPRIILTMPIPLVYQYKRDFGGTAYSVADGYFILQIAGKLAQKRLEEIQPFVGGEEAEQVRLALDIIKTKESSMSDEEKEERINKLIKDWKKSVHKLKAWMEDFVEECRNKSVSPRMPFRIWNKAYDWADFMEKSNYKKIPRMVTRKPED